MINYSQAIKKIKLKLKNVTEYEILSLKDATGRYLAEDITSQIDVPPLNNSAVDGYAIKIKGEHVIKKLCVVDEALAGKESKKKIDNKECIKITTGAIVPEGSNSVVMDEDVKFNYKNNEIILKKNPKKWQNIRRKGEDIKRGKKILLKGHLLKPQDIGIIASTGISKLKIYKKLKIALLSSGDELKEPGTKKNKTQVYDVNRYMLYSMLDSNYTIIKDFGIVKDSIYKTKLAINKALINSDIVFISGGMSKGSKDFVSKIIDDIGKIEFWTVSIKPGRPIGFGYVNSTPILGLPGNPVAAFVTFILFAIPIVKYIMGDKKWKINKYKVLANFNFTKKKGRKEFLRGKVTYQQERIFVDRFKYQGAGIISSLIWADGLIELESDLAEIKKNDLINFIPFEGNLKL